MEYRRVQSSGRVGSYRKYLKSCPSALLRILQISCDSPRHLVNTEECIRRRSAFVVLRPHAETRIVAKSCRAKAVRLRLNILYLIFRMRASSKVLHPTSFSEDMLSVASVASQPPRRAVGLIIIESIVEGQHDAESPACRSPLT
jgi:hypothetical protein